MVLTVITIFAMAYLAGKIIKKETMSQQNMEKKEVLEIKTDYCVGCGICAKLLPEVYDINNDKAIIKSQSIKFEHINDIKNSIEKCPTQAIVFHES